MGLGGIVGGSMTTVKVTWRCRTTSTIQTFAVNNTRFILIRGFILTIYKERRLTPGGLMSVQYAVCYSADRMFLEGVPSTGHDKKKTFRPIRHLFAIISGWVPSGVSKHFAKLAESGAL